MSLICNEPLMTFSKILPHNASLVDLFKAFPATSRPLLEFHEILLRGPSPFTEAERELIAAYVSGLNRCRYCAAVHTATAERLGVPTNLVTALFDEVDTAPIDETMKPVLRYACKLTRDPAELSDADADAIFAAGWDDTALYHVVVVTALFNFMNRLVEGMGIKPNPRFVESAAERLATRGYKPLIDMLGLETPAQGGPSAASGSGPA